MDGWLMMHAGHTSVSAVVLAAVEEGQPRMGGQAAEGDQQVVDMLDYQPTAELEA